MAKAKKKTEKPVIMCGLFYMCEKELTVQELAGAFDAEKTDIEVWPEAGVLEAGIGDGASMDIESCEFGEEDEFETAFVRENSISSVFYISYKEELEEVCMKLLKGVLEKFGGMLCSDTEDFSPIIK